MVIASAVDTVKLDDFPNYTGMLPSTGTLYCQVDGVSYQISLATLGSAISPFLTSQILFISTPPTATTGRQGQYAVDVVAGVVYGPKQSTGWFAGKAIAAGALSAAVSATIDEKIADALNAFETAESSDTSANSVLIVSDDTGNLDGSWLSANYPTRPPTQKVQFALAQDTTDALTYTVGAGSLPLICNHHGYWVANQTDVNNQPLPRFVHGREGEMRGLLLEPASTNLLQYNRLSLTSGVTLSGVSLVAGTVTSVDGTSSITSLVNDSTMGQHGLAIKPVGQGVAGGMLSFSGAIQPGNQQYYSLVYDGTSMATHASVALDTVNLTVISLQGSATGRIWKDMNGWVWFDIQFGTLTATALGIISVYQASNSTGLTSFTAPNSTWYVDALQLELSGFATSPMLAQSSSVVSRGKETLTTVSQVGLNWMGTPIAADSSFVLEGFLPLTAPQTFNPIAQFSASDSRRIQIGYNSSYQVGIQVTGGTDPSLIMSGVTLSAGARFKIGVSVSGGVGVGFAVNGKSNLSAGINQFTYNTTSFQSFNLNNQTLPVILAQLLGYDLALTQNQLKYLTSLT